jgi:hypothetical protein
MSLLIWKLKEHITTVLTVLPNWTRKAEVKKEPQILKNIFSKKKRMKTLSDEAFANMEKTSGAIASKQEKVCSCVFGEYVAVALRSTSDEKTVLLLKKNPRPNI